MKIEKANWQTDGSSVRITMPLQKVDEEKRIVSGFATLDSEDLHGDIVLASASRDAFNSFRGNIRLMHQPIPAGKLVNFREEEYYDPATQKFFQGIYVDVYVSKGAPEVWEMVLDGTLTGFSIGGNVTDQESQFVKDAGKVIRFIKSYDLIELSLVDNPANQLSNIFSIQKTADGTTIGGMITEVDSENVFYCPKDEIAFTSVDEAKGCNVCGAEMQNIGWFESDGGEKTEKVNAIVADFKKAETFEGRENNMPNDENETPEVQPVVAKPARVAKPKTAKPVEAPAEEVVEEEVTPAEDETEEEEDDVTERLVAEAEELGAPEEGDVVENPLTKEADDAPDFTKMFAELNDNISKALAANQEKTAEELTKVHEKLVAFDEVTSKIDELSTKQAELAEKFNTINTQIDNVEKRFVEIEKGVGIKKSGDLGGSKEETKLEKSNGGSLWNGRFLSSVDNI